VTLLALKKFVWVWNQRQGSALCALRPRSAPTWASACQTRFARVFLWARPRSHDRGLLRLAVIERIVNGGRSLHPGSVQRLPKLVVSNQPSPALPPRSTRGALLCQPSCCAAPISIDPAAIGPNGSDSSNSPERSRPRPRPRQPPRRQARPRRPRLWARYKTTYDCALPKRLAHRVRSKSLWRRSGCM
jgi:hypothetical protein